MIEGNLSNNSTSVCRTGYLFALCGFSRYARLLLVNELKEKLDELETKIRQLADRL